MQYGSEIPPVLPFILIFLFFSLLLFAVTMVLIRWIFRIDKIVDNQDITITWLKKIHHEQTLKGCEGCDEYIEREQLTKINSGQLLCPDCIENLKNPLNLQD